MDPLWSLNPFRGLQRKPQYHEICQLVKSKGSKLVISLLALGDMHVLLKIINDNCHTLHRYRKGCFFNLGYLKNILISALRWLSPALWAKRCVEFELLSMSLGRSFVNSSLKEINKQQVSNEKVISLFPRTNSKNAKTWPTMMDALMNKFCYFSFI